MYSYELIVLIVNKGQGSEALRLAKKNGVRGGTILLVRGTIKSKILEFLELNDTQRELLLMVSKQDVVDTVISALRKEFALHKPGHGIVVSMPIRSVIGTARQEYHEHSEVEPMDGTYKAIFTVVDKGLAEDVVDAGKAAGARGGTIINARGSGIHETEVLFAMPIEPEKEVVLIIAAADIAANVVSAIRDQIHIDEEGRGVMFVLDIREAHGLF